MLKAYRWIAHNQPASPWPEGVQRLLSIGADPKISSKEKLTAKDVAESKAVYNIFDRF
jgi:hypothetical protein